MTYVPSMMVGAGLGLMAWWVMCLRLPDAAKDVDLRRRSATKRARWLLAYGRWAGQATLGMLRTLSPSAAQRLELAADTLALRADRPGLITGGEVVGLTVLAPLVAAVLLTAYMGNIEADLLGPALALGVPLAAALPAMRLRDMRNLRLKRLRKSLPGAIDMLTLALEGGVDFTEGMKMVAGRIAGLPPAAARKRPDYQVCKLFGEVVSDVQMGMTRTEALRRMEEKTGLNEVGSFATVLALGDETGGAIVENLRRLAAEMRYARVMRAEEFIAKAPVKMLLPIMLFLFPVVFVLIFGPVAISVAESAAEAGFGGGF